MDNLTHSLIGYALGHSLPEPSASQALRLRRARLWAAVAGSNLPDLDFVIGELSSDRKLGYLLHHRGHTHTLLFALLACVPLGWACGKLAGGPLQPRERRELLGLSALSLLLHVGFDALNDYGVHPFFPLDNRWYYGDAVFIIEPSWWVVLAAFLARTAHSRLGRALGVAMGVFAVALGLLVPGVPRFVPLGCAALGLGLYALWRRPRRRNATLWAVLALVLSCFVAGSRLSRELARQVPFEPADARRVVLSSRPSPGNPLCWTVLEGARTEALWVVQRVQLSLWPALVPASLCGRPTAGDSTAPSTLGAARAGEGYLVTEQVQVPLAELRALAARDCRARALLQFVRLPFVAHTEEGLVLGDLRYDHEPGLGFAELPFSGEPGPCPELPVPWVAPSASWL